MSDMCAKIIPHIYAHMFLNILSNACLTRYYWKPWRDHKLYNDRNIQNHFASTIIISGRINN